MWDCCTRSKMKTWKWAQYGTFNLDSAGDQCLKTQPTDRDAAMTLCSCSASDRRSLKVKPQANYWGCRQSKGVSIQQQADRMRLESRRARCELSSSMSGSICNAARQPPCFCFSPFLLDSQISTAHSQTWAAPTKHLHNTNLEVFVFLKKILSTLQYFT